MIKGNWGGVKNQRYCDNKKGSQVNLAPDQILSQKLIQKQSLKT